MESNAPRRRITTKDQDVKQMLTKTKAAIRLVLVAVVLTGLVGWPGATSATELSSWSFQGSQPWSFGLIGDTQWTKADDGYNPNTVAANIIKQVDQQFIAAGVKFVVAIGDTVDMSSKVNIDTRALYAQGLYNAGIGFYPLRGNHEAAEDPAYLDSGPELRYAFPQIGTGVNNNTPAAITTAIITPTDLINNPPAARMGITFTVGANFSEPVAVNTANQSVSYAFRYNNATLMLLDQFDAAGNYYNSTIPQQQQWISDTLAARPADTHAFVFTHKNLLGGNHKDNLFGGPLVPVNTAAGKDPGDGNGMILANLTAAEMITLTAKQTAENNFLAAMQANQVDQVITGHDHHHYASVVTSPDGASKTHQLIAQSDSSKFYTPVLPVSANDAPVQQDLNRVGYYIFTVDGPRVTVDYYGDTTGGGNYGANGGTFHFVKMATMSYSLNGQERLVAQGGSYVMNDNTTVAATMEPGFVGTSMAILAGANGSTAKTNYNKPLVNDVTTAWTAAGPTLGSDILSLAGMTQTITGTLTDQYVLSLSYLPNRVVGVPSLLTRNAHTKWVNAVTLNSGGTAHFVQGPWNASYGLGAYGVDTATHTVWAVLNYNGDFAAGLTAKLFFPLFFR